MCLILISWSIAIQTSTQCLSRYITPPIDGYLCQMSLYRNLSDINLQLCIALCVRDGNCWTLSYNYADNYCILVQEVCASAEENPNFAMMMLRSNQTQPCVEWISFSSDYGAQKGYPARAITGYYQTNGHGTPARAFTSQKLFTGWSTTGSYKAFVFDSNQEKITLEDGFDILAVHIQCSTAWVPYKAGEPIPPQAVAAGSEDSKTKYVIRSSLGDSFVSYGSYTTDDTLGYYSYNGGLHSTTNMHILIRLSE